MRKLGLYVAPAVLVLAMSPAAASAAPASGSSPGACTKWVHQASPSPGSGDDNLYGVTATSASNAWAVGGFFVGVNTDTLIEHWNGASWKKVPSPDKGEGDELTAVYAPSANNAWAVGNYSNGTAGRNLIEHWNGKKWSVIPSPSVGTGSNGLQAIRGTSASDIWAVGSAVTSYPSTVTVILHWNGQHWRVVTSPSVAGRPNFLNGVRPLSPSQAWAVGSVGDGTPARTLILRWTSGHWRRVPSPNAGTSGNWLTGVRSISAADAWAVGTYYTGSATNQALFLHWNGRRWQDFPGPKLGQGSHDLSAIGATSASDAYAVGITYRKTDTALVVHWNGKRWQAESTPNPGSSDNSFNAVYAQSPATVWAVGSFSNGGHNRTLIEQCR